VRRVIRPCLKSARICQGILERVNGFEPSTLCLVIVAGRLLPVSLGSARYALNATTRRVFSFPVRAATDTGCYRDLLRVPTKSPTVGIRGFRLAAARSESAAASPVSPSPVLRTQTRRWRAGDFWTMEWAWVFIQTGPSAQPGVHSCRPGACTASPARPVRAECTPRRHRTCAARGCVPHRR
jgi:hypothetical protein